MRFRHLFLIPLVAAILLAAASPPGPESFRFVILGDRTGEPAAGIYETVWRQAAALNPAFVVSVGDTIDGLNNDGLNDDGLNDDGLNDANADSEWRKMEEILSPWRRYPLFLAPGNHDIWSPGSEKLFEKYSGHPAHYSFDYAQAHFTILDNSRSDEFPAAEMAFLEADLQAHAAQPLKFIVSHRPSWALHALLSNPDFPLHRLARKYGVQFVIAGHIHQMLHYQVEGIDYVSMVSSGGHLRASGKYEDGWFFGYAVVAIRKNEANFEIHDLNGRVTSLRDWGAAGLR